MRFCGKVCEHSSDGKFPPAVALLQPLGHLSPSRKLAEAAPPGKVASPGAVKLASSFLSNTHLLAIGVGHP